MESFYDYVYGKKPIRSSNPVVANALAAKAINEASVKDTIMVEV